MSNSPILVHIMTAPQSLGFVAGQVDYVQRQGLTVQVIASPGEQLHAFGDQQNIAVHAVEMPRSITPVKDLRAVWQLWRLLRQIRPTIVHAGTPKAGLLGMMAAWLARVPIRIYQIRGLPFLSARGWKRHLLIWTERIACLLADQVICNSHSNRSEALNAHLCPENKIKVLHNGSGNGVDATGAFVPNEHTFRESIRCELGIPAQALVIGYVGRIVRDKGVVELVRAWEQLNASYSNVHLLVVGRFESQAPLSDDIIGILQKDQRVHLTGYVQKDTIANYYSAMDVLVLPTYREGFPNTLLEAAAKALPAVSTRIPGCVDAVVDGVTGTLVPPRDATALAEAIRRYLDDPELRRQHGQAGRERVLRDFRPGDIWEAVYTEYERLMKAKLII